VARVEEYTDPYRDIYTPPPPAGPGVCHICHSASGQFARCWSCNETRRSVSYPIELVVPISLYRVGEQLHSVLRGYKSSPFEDARRRYGLRVAATLHRFMRDHGGCIRAAAGDMWDTVTIVPSKQPRKDVHPLERAIRLGATLKKAYRPLLTSDRPELIARARGDDRGFKTTRNVKGLRVLLIDDTFTSGATFQSAASALVLGGATVVAGVAIGRVIHTGDEEYEYKDELWKERRQLGFSFDRCCLEPD
jgi:hypothetical protein